MMNSHPRTKHSPGKYALFVLLALIAGAFVGIEQLHSERGTLDSLGGDDRTRTHVSTDKPIYRIGEPVLVRGVMLNAFSGQPVAGTVWARLEITDPRGSKVHATSLTSENSVFGARWDVPEGAAGGEYTAKISFPSHGYAPAERKFDIRAYRAPRLKTQIEYLRKAYGPGDKVQAAISIKRAEGGIPTDAKITAIARVDGKEVHRGQIKIDSEGNASASFDLPQSIAVGQGSLVFVIEDGGVVESAAKTLPILLQSLNLQVYPEGGDLVAGLDSRLYIEAAMPWGDPADIEGRIVDDQGLVAAKIKTVHEGRGLTHFVPKPLRKYHLEITNPASVTQKIDLPMVKADGVVLTATQEAYSAKGAITAQLAATKAGEYRVALFQHESELSNTYLDLEAGGTKAIHLSPPSDVHGVLRMTVFDDDDNPLAERLIFRRPHRQLKLEINTNKRGYVPGDIAQVSVTVKDHKDRPVPNAIVGITVTDDAVLEMVEKRKQAPRLAEMVLLEADVKDLNDAKVYLSDDPIAEQALDLLLGTQGWRRFAYFNPSAFIKDYDDDAKRAIAFREQVRHMKGAPGNWRGGGDGIREARAAGMPKEEADGEDQGAEDAAVEKLGEAKEDAAVDKKANELPDRDEANQADKNAEPEAERENKDARADEEREEARRRPADRDIAAAKRIRAPDQIVRVYAHKLRPTRKPGDRVDFTETLYWTAGMKTDQDGVISFRVELSDSVTSFRVMADAFDSEGRLGSGDAMIVSKEPFYVEPKLPLEVSAGDWINLPVAVINGTSDSLNYQIMPELDNNLRVERKGMGILEFVGSAGADKRVRQYIPLRVGETAGSAKLVFDCTAESFRDKVTRELKISPRGFPIHHDFGGMADANTIRHNISLPADVAPGSLRASFKVYPTPVANLTEAIECLIREPYGCFEQTSSVVYPMVMAQQYFQSHVGVDPALIKRAGKHIENGYKKLVGFECKDGGFEWFGGSPGHEALTAYGVLEFIDMAKVHDVDQDMLKRTRKWLLDRKDGEGGFKRNPRALDSFGGAPDEVTNAYIIWSLTAAGEVEALKKEIEALVASATKSDDAYLMGLAAGTLINIGRKDEAVGLLDRIAGHQQEDGYVSRAKTSITRSSGDWLSIETTSIAILSWLESGKHAGNVEKAMQWLSERCQNGRFGSTQGTVLALKAIIAYDKSRARPLAPGSAILTINGNVAGNVDFDKDTKESLVISDFEHLLEPGDHQVELVLTGGSSMPYTLHVEYCAETPATALDCAVDLKVSLADASIKEGESTELKVKVTNLRDEGQAMTTAVVGLPAGLEARHDQLKELVKAGTIDFYEVNGREINLYWRDMSPKQVIEFPIDCIAAIPGDFTGPASRAYLYYNGDKKVWREGLKVSIEARQ